MITLLLHLLRLLPFLIGGHRQLALENLALRQQLAVYKRTVPRPRLHTTDRLFWVGLARVWTGWRQALVMVSPDTVLHHTWYWADRHISTFIGEARAARLNPMKSAMRAGVVTIAHSDAPIAAIGDPLFGADPLFGIWCAVNRITRAGKLLGPEERITPLEGIRAYTINAAYASFEERLKGSIEPGKLADLAILEKDPCAVDPWAIGAAAPESGLDG